MTATPTEVYLYNVERGEPEAAELWHAITERQLADWEAEWMPEVFKGQHLVYVEFVESAPVEPC